MSQALLLFDETEHEEQCDVCESHLRKADGFGEVSQDVFFLKLMEEKRDIMPIAQGPFPYMSEWCSKSGYVWGLTVPTSRHGGEQRYFVK